MGALGLVATGRRDGFREATVIAVTIFGVGATIVHVLDIAAHGNLAPGNTVQNVGNLLKPALLIWFLVAARMAEAASPPLDSSSAFDDWRLSLARAAAPITACVASCYSLGFALDRPWLLNLVGLGVAVGILMAVLARGPQHSITRESNS
jgi:hypothetical protein